MEVVCDPCKEFKKERAAMEEENVWSENCKRGVSVGLEAGDLLFLGLKGASSHDQATQNLRSIFYQALKPVQTIILQTLDSLQGLTFLGIDASIAPGLLLPESVGFGMEQMNKEKYEAKEGSIYYALTIH